MIFIPILIILPFFVVSYNLDIKHSLIYTDPLKNNANFLENNHGSYFGYSVLLVPESHNLESQLIIGAPKGNYSQLGKSVKEYGIVYQCSLFQKCNPVSPTLDSPPDIAVKQIGMYAKVIQDHGWFGMSITALHPHLIKICAPRTKIELFRPFTNDYMETLQGMCYFYFRSSINSFLQIDTESLATYNFSTSHWYNPQHGFSQNVAVGLSPSMKLNIEEKSESTIKLLLKNVSMIFGNPTNEATGSINIVRGGKRKTLQTTNEGHEQSELGYSVVSGLFFGKNLTYFASGAPVWKFIGKVAIINSSVEDLATVTMYLYGQELGEYFGASLASGDLNNDGFDDLIVGAPHYGDDRGKVYIYFGNQNGFFQQNQPSVIEGTVRGAQYGYSLACGDLDSDGFFDLVVGAPWEEFGVIYVYYGYSAFNEEDTLQAFQKISAKEISTHLRGFGFSMSNLIDIDNNGFADVAVGAYKSSSVVLFRTNMVEKSQISKLKVQPNVMNKTTQKLTIEFCLKNYKSPNVQVFKNYSIVINVDSKYKRFTYSQIVWDIPVTDKTAQIFDYHYLSQPKKSRLTNSHWNGCISSHFNVKPNIQNVINPVDISLSYEIKSYENRDSTSNKTDEFCKICPIKYLGRGLKPMELSVPFEAECGKDKVCSSDISVTTAVYNVKNNSVWEIGSGDLGIELKLQNHGEPAYLVITDFFIPKGIHLRSVLPFCQERTDENFLIVSCNVGNPFNKGTQKIIKLDFDMSHYEMYNLSDVEQRKLSINVTVKSHTLNEGVKQISIPILLKSNVSFSISGNAIENNYQVTNLQDEDAADIAFRHEYYFFKHGATSITNGKIIILVPTTINGKSFITLKNAKLQALGIFYECESSSIPFDTHNVKLPSGRNDFDDYFTNITGNRVQIKNIVQNDDKFVNVSNDEKELFEANSSTVLVDCSKHGVECDSITCDLSPMKSSKDVGIVVLNFIIKLKLVGDIFNDKRTIQLATKALVKVISPRVNNADFTVLTTFYNMKEVPNVKKLSLWIFLISFVIGLALVSILAAILYRLGFFKKRQILLEINFLNKNEDAPDPDLIEEINDEVDERLSIRAEIN